MSIENENPVDSLPENWFWDVREAEGPKMTPGQGLLWFSFLSGQNTVAEAAASFVY